ncbi:MAG: hypothetical protein Q7S35_01415 [Candidatus Limnocylindrales bacterium]|nr:hypothetical protein [Candidatus Limnocylindrales bacterium]
MRLHGKILMLTIIVAMLAPVSTSAVGPRLPKSAADWATFSLVERTAALESVRREFLRDQELGNITWNAKQSTFSTLAQQGGGDCTIYWVGYPNGTFVRAQGHVFITTDGPPASDIYVGKATKTGQLLRDGVLKQTYYQQTSGVYSVDAISSDDFKWWFEHANYVNKVWLGAKTASGDWVVGPEAYCTVSQFL